jgi:hypothetical protein
MATQKIYGRTRTEQGTASDEAVTKAQLDGKSSTGHQHAAADVSSGTLVIARLPVAASGTSSTTQVVRADDARLSNARTPTAHATSHAAGGSDPLTPAAIAAAPVGRLISAGAGLTGGGDLNSDRTLQVNFAPDGGTTLYTVPMATDSRLANARTPTAHKTSHATGGTDALTPADIGAAVSAHDHDDRYYTEAEVNALLAAITPARGTSTATIGASGVATFSHTLGTTPAVVLPVMETAAVREWRITARTATTFDVQCRDSAGGFIANGTSVTVSWVAYPP